MKEGVSTSMVGAGDTPAVVGGGKDGGEADIVERCECEDMLTR